MKQAVPCATTINMLTHKCTTFQPFNILKPGLVSLQGNLQLDALLHVKPTALKYRWLI